MHLHFTAIQRAGLLSLGMLLASSAAHAAAGDADPTFGGAGYVRYAAQKSSPVIFTGVLGLDDGRVVAAGGAATDVVVRRYRPDGTLDATFGTNGQTLVPDLAVQERSFPGVNVYAAPDGGYFVERRGTVRHLFANGHYDSAHVPATMNVEGRGGYYSFMPQADGRFIVVTGQQSSTETFAISVRYFNPDGTPDTTRGDVHGERIVYPGGEGTYMQDFPVYAASDGNGNVVIGAKWRRNFLENSLVVIKLKADGSYDAGFGANGVVTIGTNLGATTTPGVSIGPDGRVAVTFGVLTDPSDPYFVVYVLLPDGRQDATAPSGGRIGIVMPAGHQLVPTLSLRWLSGPPQLTVTSFANDRSAGRSELMLWHADLGTGVVGPPLFTRSGFGSDFGTMASTLAGATLWVAGSEDIYTYGRVGAAPLTAIGRGVLIPIDTHDLAAASAPRIVDTQPSRYHETFLDAKSLSGGGLLALGTFDWERQQFPAPALTRFTADGWLDMGYGAGTGRYRIDAPDGARMSLVRSPDDAATVLARQFACGFTSCVFNAWLHRATTAGAADASFGNGGRVDIAVAAPVGTIVGPGFVDANGATTIVRLSDSGMLQALRYTAAGVADPAFSGAALAVAVPNPRDGTVRLDRLPDGRLQAIVAGSGDPQHVLQVFRWTSDGAAESGPPRPVITLPPTGVPSTTFALDTLVLADRRTLIAFDSRGNDNRTRRVVLRIAADGTLDPTFAAAGVAQIDDVRPVDDSIASRLAVQSDGKILVAYTVPLGDGSALAVARFTADGQRDPTFTADQRFDSLFSLSGSEAASSLLVLPDGHLLVAGRSADFGLLLWLRGESAQPAHVSAAVVEFFNTRLQHYFVTAAPAEVISVDTGGAGPGWLRTGLGFRAYVPERGVPADASPVCRFYGTPGIGPNSHFYTVSASECEMVKKDAGWTYEGTAFFLRPAVSGACANGQQPVRRAYNNRFAQNDSNHRYTTEPAEYARMIGMGWAGEGAVFCAPLE